MLAKCYNFFVLHPLEISLSLPIALLQLDPNAVAKIIGIILEGFQSCRCPMNNPNKQLPLLALFIISAW
jgi:hypothetical protein